MGARLKTLGMLAGLVIKLTEGTFIQNTVSFDQGFFFNLLLPPIILASGYELHQVNGLTVQWLRKSLTRQFRQTFFEI